MNKKLKPCPFCGGEDVEHLPDGFGNWLVGCVTCDYRIQCVSCTEDDAVRYWNTRPIEDEKDREIERLKNQVEKLESILSKIQEVSIPHSSSLVFFQSEIKAINRWCKVALGKDTDVPANPTDNNVGSMK